MKPDDWRWSLVLVASAHLLTTPGTWIVTDQAESLYTAHRLLTRGTLTLADRGETHVAAVPWAVGAPGEPVKSRLLPISALTLAPLLWLDRLVGWDDPVHYGRFVHLQGHLFVLGSLGLLGWCVRREAGSEAAAAASVVMTGLAWPVWQVSRAGGSEPIMMLLVGLFLAGRILRSETQPLAAWCQYGACALLPWVNPTGAVLSASLVLAAFIDPAERGNAGLLALSSAIGDLTVAFLWNSLYHGNWWAGGYAITGNLRFGEMPATRGLSIYLREAIVQVPLLLLLAAWGGASSGRRGLRNLIVPLCLLVPLLALFSTHFMPEPARRLSVVWPSWGLAAGAAWSRIRWRAPWPHVLLSGAAILGFNGFWVMAGRHYWGPHGLYYPSVLWVKLAIDGRPAWQTALPAALLGLVLLLAAARVWGLVGSLTLSGTAGDA